jgi:hypothetical protein
VSCVVWCVVDVWSDTTWWCAVRRHQEQRCGQRGSPLHDRGVHGAQDPPHQGPRQAVIPFWSPLTRNLSARGGFIGRKSG